MEAAVFILSLVDCCALIFLSVYFVSFLVLGVLKPRVELAHSRDPPALFVYVRTS